jgi:DNA-binding MarR family transcriptional regulator
MAKSRQALISEAGNAMQAYQRSTQSFDDAVGRALGLNPTDLRCLDWLVDGPKSMGELANGTGLSSAATTTLVDRLAQKGYAQRVRDAVDRRKVLVAMTPAGRRQVDRYYGPLVREGSRLLDGIPTTQLANLTRWLVDARELTDRHRARIEVGRSGAGSGAARGRGRQASARSGTSVGTRSEMSSR